MRAEFDVLGYRANFIRSAPFVLAVPIAIGLVVVQAGVQLGPAALVAGAVGWIVALAVRGVVAVVVMRSVQQDRTRGDPIVAGASGVADELIRLGVLLAVGRDFSTALWVGLGWGAMGVVWAIVSEAAILALIGRDPEAEQAIALLARVETSAPWWGVLERIWSTLVQIGFTLLIAAAPVLVVVTAIAHSAAKVLLVRFGPAVTLARLQIVGFAWAAIILGAAWVAWA